MRTIGEYIGANKTVDGETIISFAVDEDVIAKLEKLQSEEVVIDVSKLYGKRSKQANAMLWQLCTKIGNALGGVSKDTVYEMEIKASGVFEDYTLPVDAVKPFEELFRFTEPQYYYETVRVTEDGEVLPMKMVYLRCWKGSHLYNTVEMSHILDKCLNDAHDLGLETWTEREIDIALQYWEEDK